MLALFVCFVVVLDGKYSYHILNILIASTMLLKDILQGSTFLSPPQTTLSLHIDV